MSFNIITKLQRTQQWYNERKKIITASDVSAILHKNIYMSKREVFLEKTSDYNIEKTNENIERGIREEENIIKYFEKKYKVNVEKCGLIRHNEYEWLGASPDGLFEKNNIKYVLEIKCPNEIYRDIPINYYIQCQIQMEVMNLNKAILFQYVLNGDTKLDIIKRDKKWFEENKKDIYEFWLNIKENNNDTKLYIKKRKSMNEDVEVISKKFKKINFLDNTDFISNYEYWLYNKTNKLEIFIKTYYSEYFKKFKFFKSNIKENLYNLIYITLKWDNNLDLRTYTDYEKYKRTKELINNKVEYIISPFFINFEYKIYSNNLLLLRKDIINDIFPSIDISKINQEYILVSTKRNKNILYFENLSFNKKNNYIIIFNDEPILYNIQKIKIEEDINIIREVYDINLFNKVYKIIEKMIDNIEISTFEMSILKKYDLLPSKYNETQKDFIKTTKDIMYLMGCGNHHRREAHNKGIYKYTETEELYVLDKYKELIKCIIKAENKKYYTDYKKFYKKLGEELYESCYLDIETILYKKEIITLIGVGYFKNSNWEYKYFYINDINDEKKIIEEYYEFMNKNKFKKILHWNDTDRTIIKIKTKYYNIEEPNLNYFDLLKCMRFDYPFGIEKAYNSYNLKNIMNCMELYPWKECIIKNGMEAMNIMKSNLLENKKIITEDIIKYNEADCKAVMFLLKFFSNTI